MAISEILTDRCPRIKEFSLLFRQDQCLSSVCAPPKDIFVVCDLFHSDSGKMREDPLCSRMMPGFPLYQDPLHRMIPFVVPF